MDILNEVKVKLTPEEIEEATKKFEVGKKSEDKFWTEEGNNATGFRAYNNLPQFISEAQQEKENKEILIWVGRQYETFEELRAKFYRDKLTEKINELQNKDEDDDDDDDDDDPE